MGAIRAVFGRRPGAPCPSIVRVVRIPAAAAAIACLSWCAYFIFSNISVGNWSHFGYIFYFQQVRIFTEVGVEKSQPGDLGDSSGEGCNLL